MNPSTSIVYSQESEELQNSSAYTFEHEHIYRWTFSVILPEGNE